MYQHRSATRLRDALAGTSDFAAILRDPRQHEELRLEVLAVVEHLRDSGWPPERIIIGLKQIARDAGLSPSMSLTRVGDPLTHADILLERIVRWGVDHYFDTTVGLGSLSASGGADEPTRRETPRQRESSGRGVSGSALETKSAMMNTPPNEARQAKEPRRQ
jgi:hypothetical protein